MFEQVGDKLFKGAKSFFWLFTAVSFIIGMIVWHITGYILLGLLCLVNIPIVYLISLLIAGFGECIEYLEYISDHIADR